MKKILLFFFLISVLEAHAQVSDSLAIAPKMTDSTNAIAQPVPVPPVAIKDSVPQAAKGDSTPSALRRMFMTNFEQYEASEKERFFFFVQGSSIQTKNEDIDGYLKNGFGIGLGTDVYDSKRFMISLSLAYSSYKLIESKVKENVGDVADLKLKAMNVLTFSPEVKFRPLIINKYLVPYISLGMMGLFTLDYASVSINGTPNYLIFPSSIYVKPGIGLNFDTQSFGQFFVEANYSCEMLGAKQIKSETLIQIWSLSLGYRF